VAVFASNLETNIARGLGIPNGLSTSLDLLANLVEVRSSKDAQVVGSGDSGTVVSSLVADGSRVFSDGSLVDIVTELTASHEALVTDDSVDGGSWALDEIEECACVEMGLLIVQVELGALCSGVWEEATEKLSFETLGGEEVFEFDLGVERVGGGPALGQCNAWTVIKY